jgi:NAD(P)H-dependent FMN reductase
VIEIIAATNRPGSNTLRVASLVHGIYERAGVAAQVMSLEALPQEIFHPSAYAEKPQSFAAFSDRILGSSGVHFVVPEYNGSFPGVLKYFIDMLPFPQSFERRPVCFTGLGAGMFGALRAIEQLQMICGYRNAYGFPDRVLIPAVNKKLDPSGALTDADLQARLEVQATGFAKFAACLTA